MTTAFSYNGPALEAVYLETDGGLTRRPVLAFLKDDGVRTDRDGNEHRTEDRLGWEAAVLGAFGVLVPARVIDPDYFLAVVAAGSDLPKYAGGSSESRRTSLLRIESQGCLATILPDDTDGSELVKTLVGVYAVLADENQPSDAGEGVEIAALREIRNYLTVFSTVRRTRAALLENAVQIVDMDINDLVLTR